MRMEMVINSSSEMLIVQGHVHVGGTLGVKVVSIAIGCLSSMVLDHQNITAVDA